MSPNVFETIEAIIAVMLEPSPGTRARVEQKQDKTVVEKDGECPLFRGEKCIQKRNMVSAGIYTDKTIDQCTGKGPNRASTCEWADEYWHTN